MTHEDVDNETWKNTLAQPKVTWISHSGITGGAELSLIRFLSERCVNSRLLSFEAGPLTDHAREIGVPTRIVSPTINGPLGELELIYKLRRRLHADRNEVFIANSLKSARIMSLGINRKHGNRVCYLREDLSKGHLHGIKRLLTILILARVDGFISNSRWTSSTIPRLLRNKPRWISYPISGIPDSPLEQRITLPERGFRTLRILTLSRLTPWKGIELAIASLEIVKRQHPQLDISLRIAGGHEPADEQYAQKIERLAKDAPYPVQLLGHKSDVATLLSDADILIVPTLDPEPFGQVVVQGMRYGCLVIAPNAGGPAEIIHDHIDGMLFEPASAASIAQKIELSVSNPSIFRSMVAQAQHRSEDFSDAATIEMLDQTIHDVDTFLNRRQTHLH